MAHGPPSEELTFALRVFHKGSTERFDSVKLFQSMFVSCFFFRISIWTSEMYGDFS